MIGLGVNTMIWSGSFTSRMYALLPRLREWGFTSVEIPVFDFAAFDAGSVRREVEIAGLALTVSTALPSDLHIASEDGGVRRRTREWLRAALEKVTEAGGRVLAGPIYSPVGYLPGRRRTDAEWQRAVTELRQLEWSEGGAKLAVEPLNRFETYFLNTAADGRRLCDEIGNPQIGILFDTFHANIEEKSMAGAIAEIGPRLTHVHLSENDRGVPGSGHIPFREVIGALRKQDYRGLAVVESFTSTIPEIAAATAMWREYALSPEAFAEAAGQYLAPLFQNERR
jgi:D-psicose/D-tagatose/L-ribulose 3-epimerase